MNDEYISASIIERDKRVEEARKVKFSSMRNIKPLTHNLGDWKKGAIVARDAIAEVRNLMQIKIDADLRTGDKR